MVVFVHSLGSLWQAKAREASATAVWNTTGIDDGKCIRPRSEIYGQVALDRRAQVEFNKHGTIRPFVWITSELGNAPAKNIKEMSMDANRVCASPVLSTKDLKVRAEQDPTEIVARFLAVGEGVVAHWVEYARGLLLFVMAPGDDRSGEFYVYDRKKGNFWLLALADGVFGGYSTGQMRQKIREFRLLDFAENPARLAAARQSGNSF